MANQHSVEAGPPSKKRPVPVPSNTQNFPAASSSAGHRYPTTSPPAYPPNAAFHPHPHQQQQQQQAFLQPYEPVPHVSSIPRGIQPGPQSPFPSSAEFFGIDDLPMDVFGRPQMDLSQQRMGGDYGSYLPSPKLYRGVEFNMPNAIGGDGWDYNASALETPAAYLDPSFASATATASVSSSIRPPPKAYPHPPPPPTSYHPHPAYAPHPQPPHHMMFAAGRPGAQISSTTYPMQYPRAPFYAGQEVVEAPFNGGWDSEYHQQYQQQYVHAMDHPNEMALSSRGTVTSASKQKKLRTTHSPIAGENRLKINFLSYGLPGDSPQHFGTKGYIIPDGLSGTHEVYHQRWKFEVRHGRVQDDVVVTWNIVNLASGTLISRTETPREARVRETSGHTICNQLLRQALKSRAAELEDSLKEFGDNPTKTANTQSLIKVLKPKSCILGLLFFGLLHETVQEKMTEILGGVSVESSRRVDTHAGSRALDEGGTSEDQ